MLAINSNKGGSRHSSKPFMVKEIRRQLSKSRFAGKYTLSESSITKVATIVSWVVGGKLLLVDGLENGTGLSLGAHQVSSGGTFFCQLGLESTHKSIFEVRHNCFESGRELHWWAR